MTQEQATADAPAPVPRSRRPWLVAAAVVVGAVVIAGVGFVTGRATAPGPAIVVAAGPVLEQSPAASSLPVSGNAPNLSQRPGLDVASDAAPPAAIFTPAEGLADSPGTATGYRLTHGQVDGADLVRSLANSFGVSGDVGKTSSGWRVGDPAAEGASSITVLDDALLSWHFSDRAAAADSAGGVLILTQDARDVATALLTGIGVDASTIDWQVDRFADLTRVTAWQTVKGARTQLSWVVELGKGGAVVNASGFAAGLVEVPGYPIVGAATAVRRSALPTWSTLGPTPLEQAANGAAVASSPAATPTLNASNRPSLRVPIADVVVSAADLGLAQFHQPDGDLLILPAYRLTGDDGSRWSLIAVTGIDVHFVDVPYPTATPTAP